MVIKGSSLEKAVTGELKKTKRPTSSDKEDIVISILDNGSSQMQKAFVNVNIYMFLIISGMVRRREYHPIARALQDVL